jgi:hypothetical protein
VSEFSGIGIGRQFDDLGLPLRLIVETGLEDGQLIREPPDGLLLGIPVCPSLVIPILVFLVVVLVIVVIAVVAWWRRRWGTWRSAYWDG